MVQPHLAGEERLNIRLPHRDTSLAQTSPGNPQRQLPNFDAFEPVHHDGIPGKSDPAAMDDMVDAPLVRKRTTGGSRRHEEAQQLGASA
jgi:hypothetical protein